MYARTVNGRTLTFAVSGKLWKRSLVMSDPETGTLWSHILGEAMQGPLKGAELESIPSAMTDWKSWREKHPQTTVAILSRTSQQFKTDFYRDPKAFVMGYAAGEHSRDWGFDLLQKQPVVNDEFNKLSLLITFDAKSFAPYLYDRKLESETLSFQWKDGNLLDAGTQSTWDLATGRCLKGRMAGKQLTPLPGIISFRRAWQNFHPDSTHWKP